MATLYKLIQPGIAHINPDGTTTVDVQPIFGIFGRRRLSTGISSLTNHHWGHSNPVQKIKLKGGKYGF